MPFHRFLWQAIALIAIPGVLWAGEIAPGLETQILAAAPDELIGAMVFLADQVDVTGLDTSLHQEKAPLSVRHARVITDLQEKSRTTQGDLLDTLETLQRAGRVQGFKSYWLVNGVFVVATREVFYEIAQRPDVDMIEPELKAEFILPVEAKPSPNRNVGITPGLVSVGARRVWNELGIRGEGSLIGSLDSGVDGNHPALADRWRGTMAPASECWLDVVYDGTSFPSDLSSVGHGTHTTGTICGLAPGDTIGVAPAALWIASNVTDQGAGPEVDADIITAFQWFADPDGDPLTLDDVPDVVKTAGA